MLNEVPNEVPNEAHKLTEDILRCRRTQKFYLSLEATGGCDPAKQEKKSKKSSRK